MYGYIYKTADIRPIGPSGFRLTSKPGARYGLSWEPEAQYPLELLSFQVTPSSLLLGTGISNPSFSMTWRGTPSGVNITSAGTGYKELSSPFEEFTWTGTFPTGALDPRRVFTLNATGIAGNTVSGYTETLFLSLAYYGENATGVTYTEAMIKDLPASYLVSGHYGNILADAGVGQTLFYASSASATPKVVHVGSNLRMPLIAATGSTINVTNAAGVTRPYYLWRTAYDNTGEQYYILDGTD